MKKVGVFTFHFADNYGAVLQAYALVTSLRKLSLEANIINYHPDHVANGGKLKLPVSKKNIRADIVIVYQKTMKLYNRYRGDHGLSDKYQVFRDKYLYVTTHVYNSLNELQKNPPKCDVYITGSDQVWNPSEQFGIDPTYFLDFGDSATKRMSYAASFGRYEIPEEYLAPIADLLKKLDAISIREESGVEIANRLLDTDVQWVPDPTLLLDTYDNIVISPQYNAKYMFSYVLRSGKDIADIQKYIASKLELEIVVPHNPMKRWKDVGTTIYPGPEEWLGYIKDSEFVVTNSFHGTVFSVLFNKPFITIGLSGKKGGLNERAKSLLDKVGLSDRLLTDVNEQNVDALLNKKIDWAPVNLKIQKWRVEALEFLRNELCS